MDTTRSREPRGARTGGQFATERRGESPVALGGDTGSGARHDDPDALARMLVGHRVQRIKDGPRAADSLQLDDGTVLTVEANAGCGGCPNGQFDVAALRSFRGRIMRVEVVQDRVRRSDYLGRDVSTDRFRLFVFSNQGPGTAIAAVEGTDDPTGYYGTGFELVVRRG